ncbi:MAG: cytochrome c-type biogenesis protein CcmH [Actinomycetota bacterium]
MTMNSTVKRPFVWAIMAIIAALLLAVGASGDRGPLTQQDRVDGISKRLACPTCQGESVYVSRAAAAVALRDEIARQVGSGERSDNEIVSFVEQRFGGQILLVPRSSGIDALVWALPVVALICALVGLTVAFRRWKVSDGAVVSDADRELVNRALHDS